MLGMYGEEIAPYVAAGLAVGIFYKWFWSGDVKPDPWEQTSPPTEENEDEEPCCQRCLEIVPVGPRFCPKGGAIADPLGGYLPFINALTLGDATRSGLSEKGRLRLIVWIGLGMMALATLPIYLPLFPLSLVVIPVYPILYAANRRRMSQAT